MIIYVYNIYIGNMIVYVCIYNYTYIIVYIYIYILGV